VVPPPISIDATVKSLLLRLKELKNFSALLYFLDI